tara:strand:- start:172 stop:645 length:474 start_codon:yes stop_codon:yes gene_type:complete
MSDENPDFESQFKGSQLGKAFGVAYQMTKEFYLMYVTDDYNHEYVSKIPRTMAMAMVQESPYRPMLTNLMVGGGATLPVDETLEAIMNKGAIRLTPSATYREYLRKEHLDGDERNDNWWGRSGWLSDWSEYNANRFELWVYNHDGKYYLTRPRQEDT